MPQAPLPAPANRIQVPELIHPIVQQIGQPFDVLSHQYLPNMVSAAQKGLELGNMIGKLPREAHENAAASASAAIFTEQLKGIQDDIKFIQGRKDLDPGAKAEAIRNLQIEAGMSSSSTGGTELDALKSAIERQQLGMSMYGTDVLKRPVPQQGDGSGNPPQNPATNPPPPAPVLQNKQPGTPPANQGGNPPSRTPQGGSGEPAIPFTMAEPQPVYGYGGYPMMAPVMGPDYSNQLAGSDVMNAPVA